MPTERAIRLQERARDSTILDHIESEVRWSFKDNIKALAPRAEALRRVMDPIRHRESTWLDKGSIEAISAELDEVPKIEVNGMEVMQNVEKYIEQLEAIYAT